MVKGKYPVAGWLAYCARHDMYFYNDHSCKTCDNEDKLSEQKTEYEKKLQACNEKIELLEYKLKDEQTKHNQTKLDAADFLARKKQIEDAVKEKL